MNAIRRHARGFVITPVEHHRVDVEAYLAYRSDDPYAVQLELSVAEHTVMWTFGRALLTDGLGTASGEGDVRLQPLADDALLVELRSAEGHCKLQLESRDVRQFLAMSYDLVAQHSEREWLDVDFDAELMALQADGRRCP